MNFATLIYINNFTLACNGGRSAAFYLGVLFDFKLGPPMPLVLAMRCVPEHVTYTSRP